MNPIAISFPSQRVGFVLSLDECALRVCATFSSTTNAGTTWRQVPIPSRLSEALKRISWIYNSTNDVESMLHVHFANARDGWIYGKAPTLNPSNNPNFDFVPRIWATHDGGLTWSAIPLATLNMRQGLVVQMATHGSTTYLYGFSGTTSYAHLYRTRSNTDHWISATIPSNADLAIPAGGTALQASFAFSGSSGWFASGNDRGYESLERLTRKGFWTRWAPRSFTDNASYAPVIALSPRHLIVIASSSEIITPPASTVPPNWNNGATWLFTSTNGGTSFRPSRELSTSIYTAFYPLDGLPATPRPRVLLLERVEGNKHELVRSINMGSTWHVVSRRPALQVTFPTTGNGYAIQSSTSFSLPTRLLRTDDAGAHWSLVKLS